MLLAQPNLETGMDPILVKLSRRATLAVGYALGPILVAVTTVALWQLQLVLAAAEHLSYMRPYGIGYIAPVLLISLLSGYGPGLLSLVLSEAALVLVLMQPGQPAILHAPRDWVEVTILPLVGLVVIISAEALRSNLLLLNESRTVQARTRAVMSAASVGIAVLSPKGQIQFANSEMERIYGFALADHPAQILTGGGLFAARAGVSGWRLAGGDRGLQPIDFNDTPLGRVVSGAALSEARELICERADGRRIWIEQRATMVADEKRRFQNVLVIVADITERKTAEIELNARMEREAVVSRIAMAVRNADAPESVQHTAATALGEALAADRCLFINVDRIEDRALIVNDYHRMPFPSITGKYPIGMFPAAMAELAKDRATVRADDVLSGILTSDMEQHCQSLRIRSMIVVPTFAGERIDALLVVAMADQPREWSADEIALSEIVAAQTLSSVESARLRLKEHRIATILQDALGPSLPPSLPGLEIGSYYRAALDEANIGGDILDAFLLDTDPECSRCAFAIGDVSGKGLAAASQVATVRMMIRFALTCGDELASILARLSDTLYARDWLVGFATLFVGIYDHTIGELRYASCGHEPAALKRRETGSVEELAPTGPALGAFEGAVFESRTIKLNPGDQLLLYTDGVSEAGPTRANCLGTDGVLELMRSAPCPATGSDSGAAGLIEYLRGEIEQFSNQEFRDDVCMLVAIVGDPNTVAPDADLTATTSTSAQPAETIDPIRIGA